MLGEKGRQGRKDCMDEKGDWFHGLEILMQTVVCSWDSLQWKWKTGGDDWSIDSLVLVY